MSDPADRRNIAVLGATGSIGRSAAAVIAADPGRFRLVAAAARSSRDELLRQTGLRQPHRLADECPRVKRAPTVHARWTKL